MNHYSVQAGEEVPQGGFRGGEEVPPGGWRGGEEVPPGGWRVGALIPNAPVAPRPESGAPAGELTDVYRTLDGGAHFTFKFVGTVGQQEIDVLYSPVALQGDLGLAESPRGGYRLAGATIPSLADARRTAATWAERAWAQRAS